MSDFNDLVDYSIEKNKVEQAMLANKSVIFGDLNCNYHEMQALANKHNYYMVYGVHNSVYAYKFVKDNPNGI